MKHGRRFEVAYNNRRWLVAHRHLGAWAEVAQTIPQQHRHGAIV
jgi:hypothetical protein